MTLTETTIPTTSPDAPAGASGEVRAKRHTFSAAEKLRILREAERCPRGELGALLRREGIYSSHLTTWRRERERGLTPQNAAPKSMSPPNGWPTWNGRTRAWRPSWARPN